MGNDDTQQTTVFLGEKESLDLYSSDKGSIPDAGIPENSKTSHTKSRDKTKHPNPKAICYPGTRTSLLSDIIGWGTTCTFHQQHQASHIFWLHGPGGSGKSSVAQSVVDTFRAKGRLAASFFFDRRDVDSDDLGMKRTFVETLVGQMIKNVPRMGGFVEDALKANPDLYDREPLGAQFRVLVLEPFSAAVNPKTAAKVPLLMKEPYVVVVDGTDESGLEKAEVAAWLREMVKWFDANARAPLRVFISGRSEGHVSPGSHSFAQIKAANIASYSPVDDIAHVVEKRLEAIPHDTGGLQGKSDIWYTTGQKRKVAEHAGTSFIFMDALLNFISEHGVDYRERLAKVVEISPGIDELYTQVLCASRSVPHLSAVLSTLALVAAPISIRVLSVILEIEPAEVVVVLSRLASIIEVPDDDAQPIKFHHRESLHGFLNAESRSKDFFASPVGHRRIYERFLEIVLPFGDHKHSPATQYASVHVAEHWERYWKVAAGASGADVAQEELDAFASLCRTPHSLCDSFNTVVSTFFLTRERFISLAGRELGCQTRSWFSTFLARLLEPKVQPMYTRVIVMLLQGIVQRLNSLDGRNELQERLKSGRPGLVGPSYERLIVELAAPIVWAHEDDTTLESATDWILPVFSFVFWPRYLADLMQRNDVNTPEYMRALQRPAAPGHGQVGGGGKYGMHWKAVHWVGDSDNEERSRVFHENVALALSTLQEKFPGTVLLDRGWQWEVADGGVLGYVHYLTNGIKKQMSILDILSGLRQLSVCMKGECEHGSESVEPCPPQCVQ